MNEYISKEYIHNIELKRWSDACGAESYAYSRVLEDIAEAPIIEVKRGHWIVGLDGSYMCSECGKIHRYEIGHYCTVCGSKLEYEE